jgi:hypothetical protein
MKRLLRRTLLGLTLPLLLSNVAGQAQHSDGAVRVRMVVNPDGSRTTYKFNDAERTCVAEMTTDDGKLREKIRYQLDDAGRFSTGRIFAPDGKLRFASRYKYDGAGRMEEETQMNESGAVLHRIVYGYDQNGKLTGYSIFDGDGKLENRVGAPTSSASPKVRSKK